MGVNILGVPYGSTLSKEIAKVQSTINGKTVTPAEIQAGADKINFQRKYGTYIKFGIVGLVALVIVAIVD